jgi:hypothetical protein
MGSPKRLMMAARMHELIGAVVIGIGLSLHVRGEGVAEVAC